MTAITFRIFNGKEFGYWPGKSKRTPGGGVRKEGQMYLGKVVDKKRLIFHNESEGYYQFNPDDQSKKHMDDDEMDAATVFDMVKSDRIRTIRFGGSFFLSGLIAGMGYGAVLERLEPDLPDRIKALALYYLLSDKADMHVGKWLGKSYAKHLYPKANLYSQRVSDFYAKLGRDDARRLEFLRDHADYVLGSTDRECYVIIDSTGCQNAAGVPYTRVSRHENDVNVEFRVVIVVQRGTGIPLYYEVVKGNVVDVSTLNNVRISLAQLGLKVTSILGDAGYPCPSSMERMVVDGVEFMMRINPTYDVYSNAVEEHLDGLLAGSEGKTVAYRNRHVKVLKVPVVLGTDRETGKEKGGFLYLCQDLGAYYQKASRLHEENKKKKKPLGAGELEALCRKCGVFGIVAVEDLSEEDVLPGYYMRQAVEQFIDYAKNYGRMMPVRGHGMETICGHMMMSFIATFLAVVIKNRMNLMDSPYCTIPKSLEAYAEALHSKVAVEDAATGKGELVYVQEPEKEVFEASPNELFTELELMDAYCWPQDGKTRIVPQVPHKEANDFFKAFGLECPEYIDVMPGGELEPSFPPGKQPRISRALVFTMAKTVEDKAVEEALRKQKQEEREREKEEKEREKLKKQFRKEFEKEQREKKPPRRGRPKGSLNKKTIERMAREQAEGAAKPKRGKGRPKGSLNKKTIERMAREQAEGAAKPKRGRGRPKGSLNKKTIERMARQNAAEQSPAA